MRTTLRLALLELNKLFYSPIAWFLLVVFIFQCGLTYININQQYVTAQDLQGGNPGGSPLLTFYIFSSTGSNALFPSILSKLFLYMPLLTMGLVSAEISSGTVKLLYSSPIDMIQIVAGKFIAMMTYNLLLILILLIYVITGLGTIDHADPGLLLSGLIGVYLLLCAYAAIGLFMSCLSSYQVVAALSTFVVFAFLNYIGSVWQDIDLVRNITYFLSISGRVEKLVKGLISTKDLFYFVLIIFLFLGFSIARLKDQQRSKPFWAKARAYIAITTLALLTGYVTSIPGWIFYLDATRTDTESLTATTQQILKEFKDETLEITTYSNLLSANWYIGAPNQRNADLERWEPYIRFNPNINLKYVYYYKGDSTTSKAYPGLSDKAVVNKYAKIYDVDLGRLTSYDNVAKSVNLAPEGYRYVMLLKYKGKQTFLRAFNDMAIFPSEKEIAAALKRLLIKAPKIYFLQGELERSITGNTARDYRVPTNLKSYRDGLINQGFDLDTLSLESRDIPQDITALVIADPKVGFTAGVLTRINKYIANGGNLLVATEPGKQQIINPLINAMGVQLMDGTLVQQNSNYAPDLVRPFFTNAAGILKPELANYLKQGYVFRVSMPVAAALRYNNGSAYQIKPLLETDKLSTWNKKGRLVLDSATLTFDPANGDKKDNFATALSLTRKINNKEQRIVVTGDADFLSNGELQLAGSRGTDNPEFYMSIFGWFSNGAFPVTVERPEPKDTRLSLTDSGLRSFKIIYLGILPGLLTICSLILLIKRKRR